MATSLDGLSAGIVYGLRGIFFPWRSRLIVAGISVFALYLAIGVARGLHGVIPPGPARFLGGACLIVLGLWTMGKDLLRERYSATIWTWRIRSLGLVVQIVREPLAADLDASGGIDDREALWLGSALALDTLAAGFLVALGERMPLYLPFFLGVTNWGFLSAGLFLGRLFGHGEWVFLRLLPGIILMVMGLLRIL